MNHTEQRKRLRALFAGSQCLSPASVYDALSARVAAAVGYQIGMLAGSVASNTTLAAPDLGLGSSADPSVPETVRPNQLRLRRQIRLPTQR